MKWTLASVIPLVAGFAPPHVALLKGNKPFSANSASSPHTPGVTAASQLRVVPDDDKVAVCWEGGGFLAHAVHTGLTAGLLQASEKYRICDGSKLHNGGRQPSLMDRVKNLVSNSGGTWFSSQLIFSNFAQAVEKMASDSPEKEYEKVFTQPWKNTFDNGKYSNKEINEIATILFYHYFGLLYSRSVRREDARMLAHFMYGAGSEGLTWSNFVATLLCSTSNLKTTDTMNSATPQEWSKGKNWIVNTATVTSPKDTIPQLKHGADFRVWQTGLSTPPGSAGSFSATNGNGGETESTMELAKSPDEIISYTSDYTDDGGPNFAQIFHPSQFSVVVGNADADPPLPIAHNLGSATFTYKGTSPEGTVTSQAEIDMDFPTGSQGDLPITEVAACSSAFLGFVPYHENYINNIATNLEG